jgi:hypothetical protein
MTTNKTQPVINKKSGGRAMSCYPALVVDSKNAMCGVSLRKA